MVLMCFKKITDCILCIFNFIVITICSSILIAKHYKLPEVDKINVNYVALILSILLFANFVYCLIYKYVCKT